MSTEYNLLSKPEESWWKRWIALRETICSTSKKLPEFAETGGDQNLHTELYQDLLNRLVVFGDKQFYYFYKGFGGSLDESSLKKCDGTSGDELIHQTLIKDRSYHPNYVLRRIYDQLAADFAKIQYAISLRHFGTQGEKKTLEFADSYGEFLLPVPDLEREMPLAVSNSIAEMPDLTVFYKKPLVSETPLVITYFDVTPNMKILPYANALLIGIPFSSTIFPGDDISGEGSPLDVLVIGHELGHYVYRYGKEKGEPLSEYLLSKFVFMPVYIRNWLEEIFCDVFSVLSIEDPRVIKDLTDFSEDNPIDMLQRDPGAHPIDPIRRYIYKEANNFAQQLNIAVGGESKLEAINPGAEQQSSAGGPKYLHTFNEYGQPEKIELSDVKDDISTVVHVIVKTLWPHREVTPVEDGLSTLPGGDFHGSRISDTIALVRVILRTLKLVRIALNDGKQLPFEVLRDCKDLHEPIKPEAWKLVFHADGWISDGPPTAETNATGGLE